MAIFSQYKNDFRRNLQLALPIMVAQLGQIMVNFIDNIMVGRLGPEALAAVSLAIAVYLSFMVMGMGISFALPPLIAEADGQKASKRISTLFKHSFVINLVYAFICIVVIELALPILDHLGQDPEVVRLAKPYLRISGWTMVPLMIFQSLRCYADGMSETMPAMIASLIGNVFNVFFNYTFIYGKFGAPALGVTGAAIGTFLSRVIMILLLLFILYKWKNLWVYIKSFRHSIYEGRLFKKILNLGIPTSMQMVFEVSTFGAAALIMGTLGAIPQAAHQIAINLASMTFLTCTGFAMAATIRTGNRLGEKDYEGLQRAGYSAIIQVTFFMLAAAIAFILFKNLLPQIYINNIEVIEIASTLLILAAIFQVSDGIQVVSLGALRGIQDVRVPMVITFIAYWIFGLPISYFSVKFWSMGPIGVWLGLIFGLTISAALLTSRFRHITTKMIHSV